MARIFPEGVIVRLDHLGIAVRSISEALPLYRDLLGLEMSERERVEVEGVEIAFLSTDGLLIELLEPLDEASPIARFLDRHGEGLHHLSFQVQDIQTALESARNQGFQVIEPAPRRGAHGTQIGFLHPGSTHGVLIELVEKR